MRDDHLCIVIALVTRSPRGTPTAAAAAPAPAKSCLIELSNVGVRVALKGERSSTVLPCSALLFSCRLE